MVNKLVHQSFFSHNSPLFAMVACIGSLATIDCEPRQVRKEAAVAVDSGAGMWLIQVASTLID